MCCNNEEDEIRECFICEATICNECCSESPNICKGCYYEPEVQS